MGEGHGKGKKYLTKSLNKVIKMVKCERCGGFLVKDSIYTVGGQFLELEIARCVNCGHTVDLTLHKTRPTSKVSVQTKNEGVLN